MTRPEATNAVARDDDFGTFGLLMRDLRFLVGCEAFLAVESDVDRLVELLRTVVRSSDRATGHARLLLARLAVAARERK